MANTFSTYDRMVKAIHNAAEAAGKIPDSTPNSTDLHLREVVSNCEGAVKHARRLIEANR